jgi:periplasmic protein TonB
MRPAAMRPAPARPPPLDPTRLAFPPERAAPKRRGWPGAVASLLVHLLPLLALIGWTRRPQDAPQTIPIQLVIEQPPPEPPSAPAPVDPKQEAPPPGLRASDEFGDVRPAKDSQSSSAEHPPEDKPPASGSEAAAAAAEAAEAAAPPATPEQREPAEPAQTVALVSPPHLAPPPQLSLPDPDDLTPPSRVALPKHAAPKHRPAERPQTPTGLTLPLPLYADSARPAASARYPGPAASRDEYCAYALSLVLKHLALLPDSAVGARRGQTTLSIRIREDGAIVGAVVVRSSGYADIDERVVRMVSAVGRFPRLPMWVPGPTADFTLRLHFPHTAQR